MRTINLPKRNTSKPGAHRKRFYLSKVLILSLVFVFTSLQFCEAIKAPYIPEPLQPWVDWVLHEEKEQLVCIPQYDDSEAYYCNWPSELEISLHDQGGEFRQSWLVHHQSWVPLPGDSQLWPQHVRVDGENRLIIEEDGIPRVQLQPGSHQVTGNFSWPQMPEYLPVPPQSGLVTLQVNNEQIGFPNIDSAGYLWLKKIQTEEKIENRLKIESFRLIDDLIPARVVLHFTLDVAGSAREITLGPLYDNEQFTPVSLESTLPARLDQNGSMLVQVRPGRYSLSLTIRHTGPLHQLSFLKPGSEYWPSQEIWSFRAQSDLRLVEVEGGVSIDPLQTSTPVKWQTYPAYRMVSGESLKFKEVKRGDPHPAPDQLTLDRNLWLRFDGSGYTIQDTIKGKKNTNWRLEIDPSISLGRVAIDGTERFITKREGSEKAGIELRNGLVNLTADSLYDGNIAVLPATGWDYDFQEVKGRLHLPPGWKLLNTTGIDNISRTWIKRWTLLDIFIVLIFTIALTRLFSKPLAAIALLTLLLTYHEPDAPRYVWLALLLGITLLRYLPDGKFKNLVRFYHALTVLTLIVIVIPYTIQALRIGIYPQLARPWTSMTEYAMRQDTAPPPMAPQMPTKQMQEMKSAPTDSIYSSGKGRQLRRKVSSLASSRLPDIQSTSYSKQVMQFDPKALTQTGPGLPKWYPFETVHYSWSGPVTRDQMISFTLIGPTTNLILAFLRVSLIILLTLGMVGITYRRGGGVSFPGIKSVALASLIALCLVSPTPSHSNEIPSQELLDELQQRLLEKDDCFPDCANISDVSIRIGPDTLSLGAHVDTQLDTAIPVPGHVDHWLPQQVMIDGMPGKGLMRQNDELWVMVPAGQHLVELSGSIRQQSTLQLPFPLKPHRVSVEAEGWLVEGIHADGSFDNQLQFKRIVIHESKQTEILETGILPPFILVERTLLLGLVWKIQTKIQRLSPIGSAIVLDIPLIPGESVTTRGIRVDKGVAKINLQAEQTHLTWEAFLEPADEVLLEHTPTNEWTEIWKVDVSPIYHMEYEGIAVILHKTGSRWYPTWHPWSEEQVLLKLSRPAGVDGQTLTIEKSHLKLHPGRRTTAANMAITIKSSQGGQHSIFLPADAKLQEVIIDGKIQPIRQEGQHLTIPITPGQQNLELQWLEPKGMVMRYRSSKVDLGAPSVNASVDIHLPKNRWPLFVGGEQLVGPAVLFWSVILIIIIVAFGLSKTGWTPLRFYHWFLLGIGMSMTNLAAGLIVVGWLVALQLREKAANLKGLRFNLVQIGIVALSVAAAGSLVYAISSGLLGHPDMNIIGNGSNSRLLRWYHDVSDQTLPRGWVFSIPMVAYRIAMLAWALWISFWLVGILKWGWQQFTTTKIWCSRPAKPKKEKKLKQEKTAQE